MKRTIVGLLLASPSWIDKRVNPNRIPSLAFWSLTLLLFSETALTQPAIEQIRVWPSPQSTRVVFDLTGPVEHSLFQLSNPDRVVIDLDETRVEYNDAVLDFRSTPMDQIRFGTRDDGGLRIVLDLNELVRPKSFSLAPNESYGHRLVLDLETENAPIVRTIDEVASENRDIIVAIDAGHGGEDPGASGPGGVREKNVVMAIARQMQRAIDATPGYSALMVRDGDYYIALRERAELARQNRADIFLSIHADAFDLPSANGASVYALSDRGATSERASYLAQKENRADLIGGVGDLSLRDKDDVLASVLLDLSMTASLDSSLRLGAEIVPQMGQVTRMHKRQVEQASFMVLKSPDMPSLLIETGFISNPQEAENLANPTFQANLARSIFNGVKRYFERYPPDGTLIAAIGNSEPTSYVIQPGDTLSEIAEQFGVSSANLMQHNSLDSSVIRVGQTLEIPAS
jgi:N-acetylmuramoyl-L-alanine amidase